MERKLHAFHSNGFSLQIALFNSALFHFSNPFKENTNRPFSSNIPNCRDSTCREDQNSPSTQRRTLDQESQEKMKL
ncbi:hypothetical protein AHAS_Ahas05G0059000 [Arachis hypogaea]